MIDLLIVGGGPAGLSAALWARTLGLSATVLDAGEQPGGQLWRIHRPIDDYPGAAGASGESLARGLDAQVRAAGVEVRSAVRVQSVELSSLTVNLADGGSLVARAILLATGVRPRELDVPGARQLAGRGVYDTFFGAKDAFAGKRVIVVGGGDGAVENAAAMAGLAATVTLVVRSEAPHARPGLLARLAGTGVAVRGSSQVVALEGADRLEAALVQSPRGRERIEADAVLVKIGNAPNVELAPGLACHADGRLVVDAEGRTGAPGVFAAGEVTDGLFPRIVTAAAQGAVAARAIARFLGRW